MDNNFEDGEFKADLKWPLEDDLAYQYANQFAITDTGHEIILTFGNFIPIGFHRRTKEDIDSYLMNAEIKPVAKIVISHTGFEALFNMLKGRMDDIEGKSEK